MIGVSEAPAQLEAQRLLDAIRRFPVSGQDTAAALAVLIYLRWTDFQEAEREAIAAFEETEYSPVLPPALHWRRWLEWPEQRLHAVLRDDLPLALSRLKNSRHDALATHLHRVARPLESVGRLAPAEIGALVRWLGNQPFETPNNRCHLLSVLDQILDETSTKHSGQFRTPRAIVRLVIELAAPRAGERIYDPCFGWGSFLTGAMEYVRARETDRNIRSGYGVPSIAGVEINESNYAIALARLALAGVDDPQLELGNSLERAPSDRPGQDGFDLVVANPPWGGKFTVEPDGLSHLPIRTNDSAGLFLQHVLTQLRPHGRAVVIVPNGLLFRSGPEQRLRQWLVQHHTVEAVIAVPEGAFTPHTAIKTNILLLRRGGHTSRLRMADSSYLFPEGWRGRAPEIDAAQLTEFVGRIRSTKSDERVWDVDVTELEKVDFDLTPKRRNRSNLLGLLDALRAEFPVLRLKDCCEIRGGMAVASRDLIDSSSAENQGGGDAWRFDKARLDTLTSAGRIEFQSREHATGAENPIPYIRIKDVRHGEVKKVAAWVKVTASKPIDAKLKLRAGDVLLSKSGTIGKVGLVRNAAVGAIAAGGFFVLRVDQDRIDPHFLVAYLESSECRAWLDDRARGATIRHLSKPVLDELPVPVPALQVQQRVATQHRDHSVDALAFLSELLASARRDPIAEWLDTALASFVSADRAHEFDITQIDRLSNTLKTLRNEVAHRGYGDSHLVAWILSLNESLIPLKGARSIPRGPVLLSVLQEALAGLERTSSAIRGHMPNEDKARHFSSLLRERLTSVVSQMLSETSLTLTPEADSIGVGELAEIEIRVTNGGALPLRHIRISTQPDWGNAEVPFLSEGQSTVVHLKGIAGVPGALSIIASWTASTLVGQTVSGSRELTLNVKSPEQAQRISAADVSGTSPYVCGDPIRPERNDVFVGREDLLEQIHRQISCSGNVVLLEGNRRSGKSSVLRHLEGADVIPGWLGVYCSLQGAEGSQDAKGVPTVEVFREIANSIAKSLAANEISVPLPNGVILPGGQRIGIANACREGIRSDSPFADLREYVETVLDALATRSLGILLMLDEFDKLQEGIDNGVTSPQVPENIRFLVQTYPRFSAILTGSRRLKRLREEYWSALFGLGTRFGVSRLSEDAARTLVTEPVKGRLTFSGEGVTLCITLTACQPYLLQCLCNRIFDLAAQLKTKSVTLDLVQRAADALVEDNEHFASLWDYAGSARKRLILAICERESSGPDPLQLGVIQERLLRHGIDVDVDELIADLEFLRELDLLDLNDGALGSQYALGIPLMGTWIHRQQDFTVVVSRARLESEDSRD